MREEGEEDWVRENGGKADRRVKQQWVLDRLWQYIEVAGWVGWPTSFLGSSPFLVGGHFASPRGHLWTLLTNVSIRRCLWERVWQSYSEEGAIDQ